MGGGDWDPMFIHHHCLDCSAMIMEVFAALDELISSFCESIIKVDHRYCTEHVSPLLTHPSQCGTGITSDTRPSSSIAPG